MLRLIMGRVRRLLLFHSGVTSRSASDMKTCSPPTNSSFRDLPRGDSTSNEAPSKPRNTSQFRPTKCNESASNPTTLPADRNVTASGLVTTCNWISCSLFFQLLKSAKPALSSDEVMFILLVRSYGIERAVGIVTGYRNWEYKRPLEALCKAHCLLHSDLSLAERSSKNSSAGTSFPS